MKINPSQLHNGAGDRHWSDILVIMDTMFPNKIAGNCEMRVSGEINVNKFIEKLGAASWPAVESVFTERSAAQGTVCAITILSLI